MNENEKLANAEDESTAFTEAETQTTNDSQQNKDSLTDDSVKTAPRRKKPSVKKTAEKADTASDGEEKPKPRRRSTKKTAVAPKDSGEEETLESAAKTDSAPAAAEDMAAETVTAPDTSEDIVESQAEEPSLVISAQQVAELALDDENFSIWDSEPVGERILPPDELFSVRSLPETESETEIFEDTAVEDEENELEEYEDDGDELENIGEDGQYTLGELELQSEISDKYFAEEEMPEYDPKKPRKIDGRFDLVELFVFTLLAVMIVTTFFFRHSVVDGSSMENTLHGGEHLIISDLFYTPKRGDIIVCEDYTTKIPKPIVKRVIAVEGDRIVITANGTVYINEALLEEDYVFIDGYYEQMPIDIVVPEGEIFVMGDHRNVSADSREIGTVSVDSVLGKVLLRFYPFDKFGTVN